MESGRAVKRSLQPFSAETLTYTNKSQPEVQKVNAEANARQDYINQLKNVEASDSIYSVVQGMDIQVLIGRKKISASQAAMTTLLILPL